jgi:hypothetical protein
MKTATESQIDYFALAAEQRQHIAWGEVTAEPQAICCRSFAARNRDFKSQDIQPSNSIGAKNVAAQFKHDATASR